MKDSEWKAKLDENARDPKPQPELPVPRLPKFSPKKFSSHEEMNAWKIEYLTQAVRDGYPAEELLASYLKKKED